MNAELEILLQTYIAAATAYREARAVWSDAADRNEDTREHADHTHELRVTFDRARTAVLQHDEVRDLVRRRTRQMPDGTFALDLPLVDARLLDALREEFGLQDGPYRVSRYGAMEAYLLGGAGR